MSIINCDGPYFLWIHGAAIRVSPGESRPGRRPLQQGWYPVDSTARAWHPKKTRLTVFFA